MHDGKNTIERCLWACKTPEEQHYHDKEWGVPQHDDRVLFEFLVLESAQAGLSWLTILRKREAYRAAFAGFAVEQVAAFDPKKVEELIANPGIVRNRRKILSAVSNAKLFLDIQESFGSFDSYLWRFVDNTPLQNAWRGAGCVPAHTPQSDALSKDLRQRGFQFTGTTIMYAYMQAVGMVNDHSINCFRWAECARPKQLQETP
ncbi:DNA-3-methyladenine glycosylase I [Candidatus Methylospira mobilis]|uniref:DNA-3-methyladenine glycosylase I n=1 Tax=Candidatus Methylospira mobilis TaxID=1808979 RepID=UPI0028EA2A30|nr:DNA-3-methyladenine glycosylase I [Candidatus Methylospira mobilis]WNV04832.1 DNA-3-methyladenine glycosylase I [Candidatus Methylospira mobilis]